MACADGINGGDAIQQGCLTRTGRTHNSKKFSVFDRKANIVDGFCNSAFVAVIFLDMIQFQKFAHVFHLDFIVAKKAIRLYQVFLQSSYRNVRSAEPFNPALDE